MYTLGQAARATGKSKPTIMRAIKNGRMSAGRNEDGTYIIDPVELHRVYPRTGAGNSQTQQSVPPDAMAELRARLEDAHETIRDLRSRLDASETERRALLPDHRPWWRRWR